jgi:hypothetical protein
MIKLVIFKNTQIPLGSTKIRFSKKVAFTIPLISDIFYMAGTDNNIYLADNRVKKPQLLLEIDSTNRLRNLKQFAGDSLAVADDECIYFIDPKKGGLMSLLVHNISTLPIGVIAR